ncbi:hypothetical protein DFH94DRAFT_842849 [Russula ochroleuca]|uniref:Uncharacterized protein n=1 Tax=Russula ochroleuca TaxID=152965 RepID=A0A9P5TCI9_9AGAM|nr:hypothetical protein DFH94DRAFT_842849 [Russula ochroleuca]
MSSFLLSGFFGLTSGIRQRSDTPRADGKVSSIFHMYYNTTILCGPHTSLPAQLRKYSPPGEDPLPDDTVAYIVAKAHVPAMNVGGPVLLDVVHIAPLFGDPASEGYDSRLPDFDYPLVVALGTVTGPQEGPPGGIVTFPITVSEFVRGGSKESTFTCQQDKGTAHWRNFPAPSQGTPLLIEGLCSDVTPCGLIMGPSRSTIVDTASHHRATDEEAMQIRASGAWWKSRCKQHCEHQQQPAECNSIIISVAPCGSTQPSQPQAGPSLRALTVLSVLDLDHSERIIVRVPPSQPSQLQEMGQSTISESAPSTRSKGKRRADT